MKYWLSLEWRWLKARMGCLYMRWKIHSIQHKIRMEQYKRRLFLNRLSKLTGLPLE